MEADAKRFFGGQERVISPNYTLQNGSNEKKHEPEFKVRRAIEELTGFQTIQQIAMDCYIQPMRPTE